MQIFEYTIKDAVGIHARPAGLLVKEASKYKSTITLSSGGKKAEAKKLMAVMSMCVKCGAAVTVEVEGPDEVECAAAIKSFFENTL